jgi:hypothetical protein
MVQVFDESTLAQIERDSAQEDAVINMVYNDEASKRVQRWLRDQNLHDKVRVGVVAYRKMIGNHVIARAKVIVPGNGGFYHEEPYDEFPSDHFKTKILLVTGGA